MTAICSLCREVIKPSPPIVGRSNDPVQLFGDAVTRHLAVRHRQEGHAAALFGFNVQALEMFRLVTPSDPKFYEMIAVSCDRLAELLDYWTEQLETAAARNATTIDAKAEPLN